MKLDDFVKQSLVDIVNGIKAAQTEVGKGIINPAGIRGTGDNTPRTRYTVYGNRLVHMLAFDVAVTATDTGTVEGGGKITILAAGIGGKASSLNEEKTATRISFEIPIVYPESGEAG